MRRTLDEKTDMHLLQPDSRRPRRSLVDLLIINVHGTLMPRFDVRWSSGSIGMTQRHPKDDRSPDSRGPEEHVVLDDPTRSIDRSSRDLRRTHGAACVADSHRLPQARRGEDNRVSSESSGACWFSGWDSRKSRRDHSFIESPQDIIQSRRQPRTVECLLEGRPSE